MKLPSLSLKLTITYIVAAVLVVVLTPSAYRQITRYIGQNVSFHEAPAQVLGQNHTPPGYVEVGFSTRVIIGMTVIALAFGFLVGRGITRRVEALTDGARRVAAGDLETRIPVRGNDELAQLGATFNEMAARLQESLARQHKLEQARRDLVADVAHDLRTPLAAVQASVEALEEGVVEDRETTARYLATIGQGMHQLARLIDDLFTLSQLEAGQLEPEPETVYLEDVVQDCLAGLLPQLERKNIALEVALTATLPPVRADRHATRRLLANLLQNAIEYTPVGGRITVRGEVAAGEVQVEVSDTGPGIPPKDLELGSEGFPHIFERFYRSDEARSGEGTGLGLAIVRELVQAQAGRLWAESAMGEGATFGFALPEAEQV